jgi:hypothetical protein
MQRRTILRAAVASGAVAIPIGMAEAAPRIGAAEAAAEPLVGAWQNVVTRQNLPPLVTLLAYIPDGVLVQTSSEHPTRSPAIGAWSKTGERAYAFTNQRLIFDKDGKFIQTQKVRGVITVAADGASYHGNGHVQTFDLAGNVVVDAATKSQGKRIVVEPMGEVPGTPVASPAASPTS